jgi:hypothetical protein
MICFLCIISNLYAFNNDSEPYIKEVDRIAYEITKEIKKTDQLYMIGYGGSVLGGVKEVSLRYETADIITEKKGIEWCCRIIDQLISRIGSSELVKPHFYKGKFDSTNISVAIFTNNPKSQSNILSCYGGRIRFKFLPDDKYTAEIIAEYDFEEEYKKYLEEKAGKK